MLGLITPRTSTGNMCPYANSSKLNAKLTSDATLHHEMAHSSCGNACGWMWVVSCTVRLQYPGEKAAGICIGFWAGHTVRLDVV
jgi:hypothetical protein